MALKCTVAAELTDVENWNASLVLAGWHQPAESQLPGRCQSYACLPPVGKAMQAVLDPVLHTCRYTSQAETFRQGQGQLLYIHVHIDVEAELWDMQAAVF